MMLYRNKKAKVCLPDAGIDFFNIVAGVLPGNTLAPYLLIICLDYVLWTPIDLISENGFTLKKARSTWYPTETIIYLDYADDVVLLVNTPCQAISQQDGLKWEGIISTLSGRPWKLVEKFTYFCSNILSIEGSCFSLSLSLSLPFPLLLSHSLSFSSSLKLSLSPYFIYLSMYLSIYHPLPLPLYLVLLFLSSISSSLSSLTNPHSHFTLCISEGMDYYRYIINHIEVLSIR